MWAREYELIYIARPDLSDEDLLKILDRTRGIITDRDGHILVEDEWGKKKLAYEIKKYAKGHFMYVLFLGTPEMVDEIERTMRIDEGCLRFLTVKVEDRVHVAERIAAQAEADEAKETEAGSDDDSEASDDSDRGSKRDSGRFREPAEQGAAS